LVWSGWNWWAELDLDLDLMGGLDLDLMGGLDLDLMGGA